MSYRSTQHRSRSNPPNYRSQLPTLHHPTRPDGYRRDPPPSSMIPTPGYAEMGGPVRQSTHTGYPTHFMPDSSSSDSERILLESTKYHSALRRKPTGKRKSSVTSGITLDTLPGSRHRRRGSGPEDLALLETHILPSLSKTIDRMTNGIPHVPPLATPDPNDNTLHPLGMSSRLPSKLPTVKPSSQPSTPRPILKSSLRTPTTPTTPSFTTTNNSLRSVKGFSPSPRPQGYFDNFTPTFSPTSLLSERPPSYLSPQGQGSDMSASYHSTPKTPSRRPTISQRPSPRPSQATMDYISHYPTSQNYALDHSAEQENTPLLSPITAERAPWDEVLSEARNLGNRLSPAPANVSPQKFTVSPQKEEARIPDRTYEAPRGSLNGPNDHTPDVGDAALQRKRRETLLAIVEGVNSQFNSGAATRESSEYSGHVGFAIGSRESTLREEMANLQRPSSADQRLQGSGTDQRRFSASSASREERTGEERHSWQERRLKNNSPRICHDSDHVHQELREQHHGRDPATPSKPNPGVQSSRRSPARNSSELTYPAQAPTPLDYPSQSQREQKRRSVSTPPVSRRSQAEPIQSGKKREPANLLPRTRSSLFLPTNARINRPTSGDGLEAFGLPPSLSYVFKDPVGHADIAPAESGRSLDDRAEGWKRYSDARKAPEGFLSNGAERLFQTLVDEDASRGSNDPSRSPRRFSQTSHETPTQARRASMPTVRSDFSIASVSSAPSVYDDLAEEDEGNNKRRSLGLPNPQSSALHAPLNWRSTVPPSIYSSFARLYGEAEMQRQEVIFEICHTEALFVQRLRTVLRLFIRPLRAQDTSTWISGVPWSIARLFDWFEDIMNLHVEINTEMRHVRSDHQAVVERFAGVLKKFIPRFEVYQPYIIRLEGILTQLKGEGGDDADGNWANFREFASIQELGEDCEGLSLQNLLLEPIHHSSKRIEMLQMLLQKTPKQHVDRLPTVSLVSSMKTMFCVMQGVKAREEEYNLIKELASIIEGLTSPSSLARRERRLLIRGSCRLLVSRSQARSQRSLNGNRQSLVFLDAGNELDTSKRSGKRRSLLPVTPPDVDPNNPIDSASPSKTASSGFESGYDLAFSPIEVLVFSDVVVLVTPSGTDRWKLVEKFGTARILNVAENTVAVQGHEKHVIELDLIPVSDPQLEQPHTDEDMFMSTSVSIVQISVDPEHQGSADRQERRKNWLSSFEKCRRATTLSLEFPLRFDLHQGLSGFGGMENFNADKYQKAMGAELPPPKSPSMQVGVHNRRQRRRSDFAQAERGERDWWSFRFKEVYLEMQRDEK